MAKKLKPVHPGEIRSEDFMKPYGLSVKELALDLHGPVTRSAAGSPLAPRYGWRAASRARTILAEPADEI